MSAPKVLAFPVTENPRPVPKRSASAADKLQWYALNFPDALRTIIDALDFQMDYDREEEAERLREQRNARKRGAR
jgi:hypothetical protein